MIWPCSRPASLTRSVAPLATRNSSMRRLISLLVIGGGVVARSPRPSAPASAGPPFRIVRIVLRPHLRRRIAAWPAAQVDRHEHRLAGQDDPPLDLVLHAVEKRRQLGRGRAAPAAPGDTPARSSCRWSPASTPRLRPSADPCTGDDDVRRKPLVDPAGMAEIPRLEVAVGEAPALHLLDRPLPRPPCGSGDPVTRGP